MMEVRRGVTRTVLLTRRWAVKVPSLRPLGPRLGVGARVRSFAAGVSANHQELDWHTVDGFCPIRWSFLGLVQVYPRCEPVAGDLSEEEYRAISGLEFPSDDKPDNVGYLNGRLVWIDYGD